jgi:hypothetical protein
MTEPGPVRATTASLPGRRIEPGALPSMSRYQNSGSQSASGTRRPRRGGREGVPARSAAWTAADDLPGMWWCVLRADGDGARTGGIGYRCHPRNPPHRLPCLMVTSGTVEETVLVRLLDTPDLRHLYDDHRAPPGRSEAPPVIVSPTVRFTTRGVARGISPIVGCVPPPLRHADRRPGQHGRRAGHY